MLIPTSSETAGQGVILSSGGADGAYAVGVMKALLNGRSPATNFRPIEPGVFVGTSIGAFNAACMVSSKHGGSTAVAELERIWREELCQGGRRFGGGAFRIRLNPFELLAPSRFFSSPFSTGAQIAADSIHLAEDLLARGRDFLTSSKALPRRLMDTFNLSSLISVEPFEQIIERHISSHSVRSSKKRLVVISTSSKRGTLEYFTNESFTDSDGQKIILSSTALPGFFPAVQMGEERYIDGAVLGYTKIAPAINAGARMLHLIYVAPDSGEELFESDFVSTAEALYRMFVISWSARVSRGTADAARINAQTAFLARFAERHRLPAEEKKRLFEEMLPPGSLDEEPSAEPLPRQVTIHRYRPDHELSGPLGLLNLEPRRVDELIRRGYEDAVGHDCLKSGCVLAREEPPA